MPREPDLSRRELLRTAAAGLASALIAAPASRAADPDRIRRENEQPGTRDWMATNVRVDPATKYRSPWIEGYAVAHQRPARARRSRSTSAPTRRRRSSSTSTAWATTRATAAGTGSGSGPFQGTVAARPARRRDAAPRVRVGALHDR